MSGDQTLSTLIARWNKLADSTKPVTGDDYWDGQRYAYSKCADQLASLAAVRYETEKEVWERIDGPYASPARRDDLPPPVTPQQRSARCPRCDSPQPYLHPSVQSEGEVQLCPDPWHGEFNTLIDSRKADALSPSPSWQKQEADLHELISDLYAVIDPEAHADLAGRVQDVLGMQSGACGNPICHERAALSPPPDDTSVTGWQPIATLPDREMVCFFCIVPKTPEESYCNTSGDPIFGTFKPFLHRGKHGTWSSLSKATHWHPDLQLPAPPDDTRPATQKEPQ